MKLFSTPQEREAWPSWSRTVLLVSAGVAVAGASLITNRARKVWKTLPDADKVFDRLDEMYTAQPAWLKRIERPFTIAAIFLFIALMLVVLSVGALWVWGVEKFTGRRIMWDDNKL